MDNNMTDQQLLDFLPVLKEAATNANNPNASQPMETAIKWINTATPQVILDLIGMIERFSSEQLKELYNYSSAILYITLDGATFSTREASVGMKLKATFDYAFYGKDSGHNPDFRLRIRGRHLDHVEIKGFCALLKRGNGAQCNPVFVRRGDEFIALHTGGLKNLTARIETKPEEIIISFGPINPDYFSLKKFQLYYDETKGNNSPIQKNFEDAISVLAAKKGVSNLVSADDKEQLDEATELYGIEAPACYFSWHGVDWIIGQSEGSAKPDLRIICTSPEDLAEKQADKLLKEIDNF